MSLLNWLRIAVPILVPILIVIIVIVGWIVLSFNSRWHFLVYLVGVATSAVLWGITDNPLFGWATLIFGVGIIVPSLVRYIFREDVKEYPEHHRLL